MTTPTLPKKNHRTNKKSGFTMIELLVVATIIIVLTTLGLVSFQQASRNARNGKRAADIQAIRSALVLYRSDFGSYPDQSFSQVVTTLNNAGYYSQPSLEDPVNDATYRYEYITPDGGITFSLCYYEEPSATQVCFNNP